MNSLLKSTLWVASLSVLLVVLIISGAQSGQSKNIPGLIILNGTSTSTFFPTITISSTLTSTPTSTPTSAPTSILTSTPSSTPTPTPIEILIEDPDIHPAYNGLCESYWYLITNERGHNAYLTLNVNDPNYSTNWAEWRPTISEPGFYRVEAYIPSHSAIVWDCSSSTPKFISGDTSDARYTIHHANGQTPITGNQSSSNEWLPLGEYFFRGGSHGFVSLSDLNGESNFLTTVSFSAMRFIWQRPPPTLNFMPMISNIPSPVITGTVGILNAPALDQCHLPTVDQMQTWWNNSPYRITNVYIGGGLLLHDCSVPDRNWIEAVRNQGWGMIPTWVGPQAPCSGYRLRMSADPDIAFQQGQAEADAASWVASEIGLVGADTGDTIIYYDVENYNPADITCREVVKSFIAGWTDRLHSLGNRSGSYGGACTSYISDLADAEFQPENVWVAAWNANHYMDNVPLFGITCLPDYFWPDHQRIRQYAPGHNETYGGVTFNIDSNIADAEVILPSHTIAGLSPTTYISSSEPEITNFGSFLKSPEQGWLITDGSLYHTPVKEQKWQPFSAPIAWSAIRNVFFLDENHGWMIAAPDDRNILLYSTSDGGQTWHEILTLPNEPGWFPYSLQFLDSQQGWIVVKEMTGSNFSAGRLLRTLDGGKNWLPLDLPIGEAVSFITPNAGWIVGGVSGKEIYRTRDGGQTWSPVPLPLSSENRIILGLPTFSDPQNGILPAIILASIETRLEIYTTHDGGETWALKDTFTHLPEGFASVLFSTPQVGWSVTTVGTCNNSNGVRKCNLHTDLWRTQDGGKSWAVVEFP